MPDPDGRLAFVIFVCSSAPPDHAYGGDVEVLNIGAGPVGPGIVPVFIFWFQN